ncbi:MAG: sigma-70 family RNA polymerase sigma factor [Planctomycetes bacterium]|nr:sigma-70 family RNA polymerase sigma factor [Planctomycetota bacterium]
MAVVSASTPILESSDEDLLSRFLKGDRSSLETIFHRYRETAYRVAHRLLGNEADALDAVQEGFIKALTHLHSFERRSSFKTWLLRIVSNASLDLGRQRGRRETLSIDSIDWREQDANQAMLGLDPIQAVEQADLREALDTALAELPESQRRTFVLHVDGGLSYREIADVMKISIGTVMSRLFYARQKLKGLLASRMTV